MARDARTKSETGIYHIVMRGSGRQLIFEDSTDRRAFLDKLRQLRDEQGLTIYAFCLMSNHVHLLAKEGNEPIGSTMKRLGVSYAMRFNLKTGHVGHVFLDRYASEPVNDDSYLLAVVRYIHANPEVAGICKQAEEFLLSKDGSETLVLGQRIGNKVNARVVMCPGVQKVLDYEAQPGMTIPEYQKFTRGKSIPALFQGDLENGYISAGMGIGAIHEVLSCKEIVERTMSEYEDVRRKMAE